MNNDKCNLFEILFWAKYCILSLDIWSEGSIIVPLKYCVSNWFGDIIFTFSENFSINIFSDSNLSLVVWPKINTFPEVLLTTSSISLNLWIFKSSYFPCETRSYNSLTNSLYWLKYWSSETSLLYFSGASCCSSPFFG